MTPGPVPVNRFGGPGISRPDTTTNLDASAQTHLNVVTGYDPHKLPITLVYSAFLLYSWVNHADTSWPSSAHLPAATSNDGRTRQYRRRSAIVVYSRRALPFPSTLESQNFGE
ncbi:MAG: hypothetical protein QOH07_3657, partial [Mycobacterium sp.]|nr:hypothetical protein [Mycobacterium sp.]